MITASQPTLQKKSSLQGIHLPVLDRASSPHFLKKEIKNGLGCRSIGMASSTDLAQVKSHQITPCEALRTDRLPPLQLKQTKMPNKLEIVDPIRQFGRQSPRKRAARLVRRLSMDKMPEKTLETQLLHARNIVDRIIEKKKLGCELIDDRPIPKEDKADWVKAETTQQTVAADKITGFWKGVLISEISLAETEPAEGDEISWLKT